jgi:hypothetical protein
MAASPGARSNRRALLALVALLPLGLAWNPVGIQPSAQSATLCGYVRNRVLTTTSVPIGTYCANSADSRCHPGFPIVSVDVLVLDAFACGRGL